MKYIQAFFTIRDGREQIRNFAKHFKKKTIAYVVTGTC